MRLFVRAALAVLLAAPGALAQTVPARGEVETFDVASWNLEFFGEPSLGPPDAVQLSNVVAVIKQAEIDLWAFQEVVDPTEWSDLLGQIQGDGYSGILGPQVSNDSRFDQKLAFVFDQSVIQVIGQRTILDAYDYEFAGRLPLELQARVTVNGVARTVYVITFHAKASTGSSDYARRAGGAVALKEYIDARIDRGETVILLGDFNDYLTRATRPSESDSPYAPFLADDDYVAATLAIEQANGATYCSGSGTYTVSGQCSGGNGSTRDHLLFTANLSAEYLPDSGDRYVELVSAITNYKSSTSDHLPVIARFGFAPVADEADPDAGPVALLAPAPSPFRDRTTLRFRLDAPADVMVDVVDVLGRRVFEATGTYGTGEHALALDGGQLAPGLYVVRLQAGDVVRTRVLVYTR